MSNNKDDNFEEMFEVYEQEKAKVEKVKKTKKQSKDTINSSKTDLKSQLTQTTHGNIKPTNKNLALILRNDENLKNILAYNEFNYDIELRRPQKIGSIHFERGRIDGVFTKALLLYISEEYDVDFKKGVLQDILETVARENVINPVKDYLLKCEKECQQNKNPLTIISDYLGVEDNDYTRLVTDIFFRGAIVKVFEPREPFDFVLDLVGDQGTGKSKFLAKVFDPFFTDNVNNFHNKDDYAVMVRSWGVEDAEMVASRTSGFDRTKKFITQTQLEYRPPYGYSSILVPKNFVISRTTNNTEHLRDATGDRRSLPIKVSKNLSYKYELSDLGEKELIEFWGGMMKIYRKKGNNFRLAPNELEMIEQSREQFQYKDDITTALEDYTKIPLPDNFYKMTQWERTQYIQAMFNEGKAYADRARQIEIIGTVKRDRVIPREVINELFEGKNKDGLTNKIRSFYIQNGWEQKKSMRYGDLVTNGFIKKA